jgi:hypothetical protein
MKTLAGWIVGVFGLGLFLGSLHGGGSAAVKETESVASPAARPVAEPVPAKAPAPAAAPAPAPVREEEVKSRSVKDSALIIGGAAGAGAGIGAIAKGKKGAAVGAAIGGVAGAVYDLATRNPKR